MPFQHISQVIKEIYISLLITENNKDKIVYAFFFWLSKFEEKFSSSLLAVLNKDIYPLSTFQLLMPKIMPSDFQMLSENKMTLNSHSTYIIFGKGYFNFSFVC